MDIETKQVVQSLLNVQQDTIKVVDRQREQIDCLFRLSGYQAGMIDAIVRHLTGEELPEFVELGEKAKAEVARLEALMRLESPEPPPEAA